MDLGLFEDKNGCSLMQVYRFCLLWQYCTQLLGSFSQICVTRIIKKLVNHFYIKIVVEEGLEEESQTLIDVLEEEQIWSDATRVRLVETHDSDRITVVVPGLEQSLLVLIATIPGIPMLQAGQEVGATVRYGPGLKDEGDWRMMCSGHSSCKSSSSGFSS